MSCFVCPCGPSPKPNPYSRSPKANPRSIRQLARAPIRAFSTTRPAGTSIANDQFPSQSVRERRGLTLALSASPRHRQRAAPCEGGIAVRQQQVPGHRTSTLGGIVGSAPFLGRARGKKIDSGIATPRTMSTMRSLSAPAAPVCVPPSAWPRPASTRLASPSSSPREATQSPPRAASTPRSATCTRTTGDGTCTIPSRAPTGSVIRTPSTT